MRHYSLQYFFNKLVYICLFCIFLIILAGSIVRMSNSGMGCPDWPKCFGKFIPPTSIQEIKWHPNNSYKKGNMIIFNEILWIAVEDFVSESTINLKNWKIYPKHNYSTFNVFHTWTEYINRMIGAISGIPILLVFIFSFYYIRKKLSIFLFSSSTIFMFGLEAWLGKVVVDGNLIPFHISLHMLGSLIIVFLLINMIRKIDPKIIKINKNKKLRLILIFLIGITFFQIILGSMVRQEVDTILSIYPNRNYLIERLPIIFKIHRSFSIFVLLLNLYFFYTWQKLNGSLKYIFPIMIFIVVEILMGIFLTYLNFPRIIQPLHLIVGFFIFMFQYNLYLKLKKQKSIRII